MYDSCFSGEEVEITRGKPLMIKYYLVSRNHTWWIHSVAGIAAGRNSGWLAITRKKSDLLTVCLPDYDIAVWNKFFALYTIFVQWRQSKLLPAKFSFRYSEYNISQLVFVWMIIWLLARKFATGPWLTLKVEQTWKITQIDLSSNVAYFGDIPIVKWGWGCGRFWFYNLSSGEKLIFSLKCDQFDLLFQMNRKVCQKVYYLNWKTSENLSWVGVLGTICLLYINGK